MHWSLSIRFLGKDHAEYFLHPVIKEHEMSPRAKRVLKRIKVSASAEELWKILREISENKLENLYDKLPGAVKEPSLEILPCKQFHKQMNHFKDRLALMYRASQMNEDKTSLIITNNPLPDLNGWEAKGSPMCYVPEELLRKKPKALKGLDNNYTVSHLAVNRRKLPRIIKNSYNLNKGRDGLRHLKFRFATEDSLESDNLFPELCTDNKEQRHISLIRLPKIVPQQGIITTQYGSNHGLPAEVNIARKETIWEPLTLSALMETKPTITASGEGNYKHGKTPLWTPKSSVRKQDF